MNNVLVVVAHPDDELLGCGATIAKHIDNKDNVSILILSTGVESRYNESKNVQVKKEKYALYLSSQKVSNYLGFNLHCEDFPDQKFDSLPLIKIVKKIEKCIGLVKPNIVYTHLGLDLNLDHKLTFESVVTACRPCNKNKVKEIYLFETVSSTEWSEPDYQNFRPNYYNIINESQLKKKLKALGYYESEMRDYPHPRSYKNIENKASVYGSIVLEKYAEPFKIFRIIRN